MQLIGVQHVGIVVQPSEGYILGPITRIVHLRPEACVSLWEETRGISTEIRNRARAPARFCPASPWGDLSGATAQGEAITGITIGEEEVKPSLFVDDMMVYLENPRESMI